MVRFMASVFVLGLLVGCSGGTDQGMSSEETPAVEAAPEEITEPAELEER